MNLNLTSGKSFENNKIGRISLLIKGKHFETANPGSHTSYIMALRCLRLTRTWIFNHRRPSATVSAESKWFVSCDHRRRIVHMRTSSATIGGQFWVISKRSGSKGDGGSFIIADKQHMWTLHRRRSQTVADALRWGIGHIRTIKKASVQGIPLHNGQQHWPRGCPLYAGSAA